MDRRFVQPICRSRNNVALVVADTDLDDDPFRRFWDAKIQVEIDREHAVVAGHFRALKKLTPKADLTDLEKQLRADAGWGWSAINPRALVTTFGAYVAGKIALQQPHRYAVCAKHPNGLVPVGMLLLAERFHFRDADCVYVWFLSTAPSSTLATLGVARPNPLGRIVLDHAISRSFHLGYSGRIVLHADPAGGQVLVDWYEKLGLERVPADAGISPVRNRFLNDGRYFAADEQLAEQLSREFDSLRRVAGDA